MARYKRSYKPRKRKSKYSEAEKLAFNLARVQTGLKNPNSKITQSYNNGLDSLKEKKSKPMF